MWIRDYVQEGGRVDLLLYTGEWRAKKMKKALEKEKLGNEARIGLVPLVRWGKMKDEEQAEMKEGKRKPLGKEKMSKEGKATLGQMLSDIGEFPYLSQPVEQQVKNVERAPK